MLTSKADWRWPKRCTQCLWITNLKDTTKWIFAESWGGGTTCAFCKGHSERPLAEVFFQMPRCAPLRLPCISAG
jgi:hypothetical protein